MIEPLTNHQKDAIEFYNGYGVAVEWFVGSTKDDGTREFIGMGDGFVWAVLVDVDGGMHTSEATTSDFETGITI